MMNDANTGFIDFFSDQIYEVDKPKQLLTEGKIPIWLTGTLIRNGPAVFGPSSKFTNDVRRYDHIFDGLAKLTKFDIKEGNVMFMNKFLRSYWYEKIINDNQLLPSVTGTAYIIK